jgi:hypothetical protein
MRPNVRDKLLEFDIRGLFAAAVADNQDARAPHGLRSGLPA